MLADDLTDPTHAFSHLDASTVQSRGLAAKDIYPERSFTFNIYQKMVSNLWMSRHIGFRPNTSGFWPIKYKEKLSMLDLNVCLLLDFMNKLYSWKQLANEEVRRMYMNPSPLIWLYTDNAVSTASLSGAK